jgi:hypothetical protein
VLGLLLELAKGFSPKKWSEVDGRLIRSRGRESVPSCLSLLLLLLHFCFLIILGWSWAFGSAPFSKRAQPSRVGHVSRAYAL